MSQLIQEAYYGKIPELIKCEELLQKAIDSNTGNKELKEVGAILQKVFNFKKLILTTLIIGGNVNVASTYPVTSYKLKYVSARLHMEKSPYGGVQFKTEDKVEAVIFIGLTTFKGAKMTGEEALAIILHEIGHSMRMILPSAQIVNAVGALSFCSAILPNILVNFFSSPTMKLVDGIDKVKSNIEDGIADFSRDIKVSVQHVLLNVLGAASYLQLYNTYKGVFTKSVSFMSLIKDGALKSAGWIGWKGLTTFNKIRSVSNVIAAIRNVLIYKEEVLSDFIPTAYGYAAPLTSGLGKVTETINKQTLMNPITRLLYLPMNIVSLTFDPHPNNVSRFKMIIENLENELKKSINADAYDAIQEDIELAKKELKKYNAEVEKAKFRNADIILYRKIMGKIIDGHDDVRALFFGLKDKDLKMLDDLEKLPVSPKDPESLQECHDFIREASINPRHRQAAIDLLCE